MTSQFTPFAVDCNTRYASAVALLNSRIEVRSQIQIYHIVVIVALCTVFASTTESGLLGVIFSCSLPLISSYFISIYNRNEIQLEIVSRYISELELISDESKDFTKLPRFYNKEEGWISLGRTVALRGKNAMLGLALVSPLFLLMGLILRPLPERFNSFKIHSEIPTSLLIFLFVFATWVTFINYFRVEELNDFRSKNINQLNYDRQKRKVDF